MKRLLRLYRAIERIEELGGKACWIFGELCEIGKRLRNVEHDIERIMAALEKPTLKSALVKALIGNTGIKHSDENKGGEINGNSTS